MQGSARQLQSRTDTASPSLEDRFREHVPADKTPMGHQVVEQCQTSGSSI